MGASIYFAKGHLSDTGLFLYQRVYMAACDSVNMAEAQKIVRALIGIFVGIALIGPVQTFINDANLTGSTALIVGLVPLFVGLGVLVAATRMV